MRLMLMLFALVLAAGTRAAAADRSIEAVIDRELAASGAPGVAYAIVDHGIVRSGGRGALVAGGDRPVTADTPFLIGSISKSFTALAVMQLVEAGKVSLDSGIAAYLPAFRGRPSGAITIRQLLSHTSGFSTVQGNKTHMDGSLSKDGVGGYVSRVAGWKPAYRAGERWEYSNTNYRILGALIEAVSGLGYADYVQANIFAPLGMTNSFVSKGQRPKDIAVGHRPWFGGKRAYEMGRTDEAGAPAGGIFASANDLALYLDAMLNNEDDILSAAGKAAMLSPASEISPFYGFGWFLDAEAGTAFHDGLVPGTETLANISPSEGKGVAVLVNANSGIGFGETLQLRKAITAKALGRDYSGEGSRLWPKATYLLVMLLPLFFLASIAWAWANRQKLRAKSGLAGKFSLWFPLLAMSAVSGVLMLLVPAMFGGSIATLLLFQPDFAGAMVAAALIGPAWAIFRLAVAYGGRARPT